MTVEMRRITLRRTRQRRDAVIVLVEIRRSSGKIRLERRFEDQFNVVQPQS